jgi:hypothetical protein
MQTVRKLEGINGNLHTFTDPENCKRSQMAGCSVERKITEKNWHIM